MKSLVLLLVALFNPELWAESNLTSRGELRLETRAFTDDNDASTKDFGYGMAGRIEIDDSWKNFQSRIQLFSRVDRLDESRLRFNIEEAYSQYQGERWGFFAGFKTLNWSTAEAFHPSDVVNSRNFDSNFENAEKLGELMAGTQYLSETINVYAFFMPSLISPQLPASSNRLSFAPAGVPVGNVQFIDNDGQLKDSGDFAEQWALRLQVPLEDWEFNLYWVHHYDRTDFRILTNNNTGEFIPVLSPVDHFAFAFQYVWDAWIFKSENVYRQFQESTVVGDYANTLTRNNYGMSSLALEYLMPHESGSDTTFIVEFQELYGVPEQFRYSINPFQRDGLIGIRHAYNDVNSKELFFGVIADLERTREIIVSANYSQRLSDVWKIKLAGRYVDAPPQGPFDGTGIRGLNNDHQFEINLSRFF